jgi:uncharacterized protein YkwD
MAAFSRLPIRLLVASVAAAALLLLPLLNGGSAQAAGCANAYAMPGEITYAEAKDAVLCLVNKRRRAHGIAGLRGNPDLRSAARRHTADMVGRGYFSHVAPGGVDLVDRVRRTGYLDGSRSWGVGENIAWGTGSYGTPARIVQSWMNSPGHRANILNRRFREIGIGIVPGSPANASATGGTYTTDFGYRHS